MFSPLTVGKETSKRMKRVFFHFIGSMVLLHFSQANESFISHQLTHENISSLNHIMNDFFYTSLYQDICMYISIFMYIYISHELIQI
eukprot:c1532_g1_i1 orf=58-318(+)